MAASENVLFTGTRSLYHLIVGAGTFIHETLAKTHRAIIDNAGFLKGKEIRIAPMLRNESIVRRTLFVLWPRP